MSAPQKRKIDDRGDEHDGEDLDKRRRLQPNFGDLDIATADVAHVGHQPLEAAKVPGAASTLGFGVVQAVPAVDSPKDNLIAVDQAHTLVGTGMQVATVALSDGVAVSGAADSMSVPEAATAPPDASLSSGALSPGTLPPGSLPHSALPAAGISPNDFAAAAISAAAISAAAISAATLPAAAMPSGALATETSHTLMGVTGVGVSAPQLSSFDAAAHAVGDAQIASAAAAAAAVADATAVVGSGLLTSSNGIASIAVESNAPQAFTPHADGRSRPFLCGICGKGFLRTGDKNRHIKTVHEKLRKAQCHICGGTFGHKGDLGRHITRVHEKGEFRKCTVCGATFQSNAAFNAHRKIHANRAESGNPFPCAHCRKSFVTDAQRVTHEGEAHATLKFTCQVDDCQERFPSARSLKSHTQARHTLVLVCPNCPASFRLQQELAAHVAARHTPLPIPEQPHTLQ